MSAGDNCGHTSPDRTFSNFEFAFAFDQRGVTDLNAGDISDGIVLTRSAFEWNTEISGADNGARFGRRWCWYWFAGLGANAGEAGDQNK
jgi:hypothetical protein